MKCLRRKGGFTLIEMLLVILIIGVLVGILAVRASDVGSDAKKKAVAADLKTLKAAVEVYYIRYGQYPEDDNGYFATDIVLDPATRLVDEIPDDPYGTNIKYGYDTHPEDASARFYCVYSVGQDGTGYCHVNDGDIVFSTDTNNLWVSNCRTNNHNFGQ